MLALWLTTGLLGAAEPAVEQPVLSRGGGVVVIERREREPDPPDTVEDTARVVRSTVKRLRAEPAAPAEAPASPEPRKAPPAPVEVLFSPPRSTRPETPAPVEAAPAAPDTPLTPAERRALGAQMPDRTYNLEILMLLTA